MAAESHTDVAVVSPCTSGTLSSPVPLVPFQIEAAPRKPTPEGMAADTREASHPIVEEEEAKAYMLVVEGGRRTGEGSGRRRDQRDVGVEVGK